MNLFIKTSGELIINDWEIPHHKYYRLEEYSPLKIPIDEQMPDKEVTRTVRTFALRAEVHSWTIWMEVDRYY